MARKRQSAAAQRDPDSPRQNGPYKTISVSLPTPLANHTSEVARHTYWAQSRVVSNALTLYTGLPVSTVQRMAELEERLGAAHFKEALVHAIEREIDRLEWDATAEETSRELEGRLPASLSEEELVAQARSAIAASRAARRGRH
jgi:hypothetical protein